MACYMIEYYATDITFESDPLQDRIYTTAVTLGKNSEDNIITRMKIT